MHENWLLIGAILTVIISLVTVARYLFYTKSEIDKKFADLKTESDKKDEVLLEKVNHVHTQIKEELVETKEKIFDKIVEEERNTNKITQEIYDRLTQNKQIFDDYNKNMLEIISQIKQEDKQLSNDLLKLLSDVKDELRSDYMNRYNELIKLIGTKVSVSDFDRLETKFDRVTETITELKTIVQMQLEEGKNNKG